MQSNLYVHTKYENMEETYLYPIWEFFIIYRFTTQLPSGCHGVSVQDMVLRIAVEDADIWRRAQDILPPLKCRIN